MFEARKTFKQNYVNAKFIIQGPFERHIKVIEDGPKSVVIKSFESIYNLLNQFGDLIERLSVSFNEIDIAYSREIITMINLKLSDFLEDLELIDCKGDIFDRFKNTLKRVFSFRFSSDPKQGLFINLNTVHLNTLAPELYSLKLDHVEESDWTLINGRYNSLRKLAVSLRKSKSENKIDTKNVVNFLRENPTIGVLAVENCSLFLLKEINDILPQLDTLYISNLSEDYVNYDGKPIDFQHVRQLSIGLDYDQMPAGIMFSHLNKLTLSIGQFDRKWMEFLNNLNPDVKFLDIQVDHISKAHFVSISEKLHYLERAEFECPLPFTADDINNFIEKSHTLDEMILKIQMETTERERLKDILPVKLNVRYYTHVDKMVIIEIKRNENGECSPGSLDATFLNDLLTKATIDRECLSEARKAFHAYTNFTFMLSGPFTNDKDMWVEENDELEVVFMKHLDVIRVLLSNFGHLIQSIIINFKYIETEVGREIINIVDEKCYKSLTMIYLLHCRADVLNGLKTEFVKLTSLEFLSSEIEQFNISSDKLRQSFPKLKILSLELMKTSDLMIFTINFPHLTTISIRFAEHKIRIDESQFGRFLKCNPQLKTLNISYTNLELLHEINENAPQLGHLTINRISKDFSSDQNEPIHFSKLTSFALRVDHIDEWLENISFFQLDMIALYISSDRFNNKWMQFLTNQVNSNVKTISVECQYMEKEHLLEIAERFFGLETFSLICKSEFTANLIVNFIGSSKHLINLEVEIEIDEFERLRLTDILPERWELVNEEQVETRTRITLKT